tara:strand:- start:107 stop:595 length:489 start_codon:yes stop_codon:yes gene_type:complete
MMIARLNGSTIVAVGDHTALFPNTRFYSGGLDSTWMANHSCVDVVKYLSYDHATQKSEVVTPYLLDGKVYTRRVVNMTSNERAAMVTATNAATAQRNRSERDKRLACCDWVVTKALEAGGSVPSAWVTYRTALRNIPTHANWPNLASPDMQGNGGDWPSEPS